MMKIQLDHKALLGIIEADKEFELEVRRGVLESVLNKVMSPKDKVYDVVKVIKEVLDKLSKFDAELTKKNWEGRRLLTKKAMDLVDKTVKKHLTSAISSHIHIDMELTTAIDAAISKNMEKVDSLVAKRINKGLSKHIDKQVELRLEMLGESE